MAGRGAGLEGKRSGLWFELFRIISDIRPKFAIIENVPMLTSRGGTRVIADLAEIGMDAEWQIISAAEVGAWHLRKRIWIVAYPHSKRHRCSQSRSDVSDSDSTRRRERRRAESVQETFNSSECDSQRLPSDYWSTEPNVGRVANGIPNRVDRLKGLGNAIVPQCVYPIMIRLKELMNNE